MKSRIFIGPYSLDRIGLEIIEKSSSETPKSNKNEERIRIKQEKKILNQTATFFVGQFFPHNSAYQATVDSTIFIFASSSVAFVLPSYIQKGSDELLFFFAHL